MQLTKIHINIMKTSTNNFTGFDLESLQELFPDHDFAELEQANEDDLDFIEQCHFGDMLIDRPEFDRERYRLWRKLDTNGGGILIEYCGAANNYVWQTVYES